MPKILTIIRWILTPPSAFLGWFIAFIGSINLLSFFDSRCSPELVVSDFCTAKWYLRTENVIVNGGAGLAAVLIVLLPTFIAPAYRSKVALITYGLGTIIALWMGRGFLGMILIHPGDSSTWSSGLPVIVALIAGLITLLILRKLFQKS